MAVIYDDDEWDDDTDNDSQAGDDKEARAECDITTASMIGQSLLVDETGYLRLVQ